VTELAAPQISSLMEALPGIAAVLRSPVANAMVAISRSAAGLEEFQLVHAEELLRFGVRRNLLTPEEVDKVLDELRDVVSKRPAKPVPPVVKKAVVVAPKPELPKVPHRPKGIQLKPAPKRPMPPPPPPPPAKPKPVPPAPAKKAPPVKKAAAAKPARKPVVKKSAKKR
jgi:outer membrane biosynthesis protein TonB